MAVLCPRRILASTLRAGDRKTVRVILENEATGVAHEKDLTLVNLFHNYRVSSRPPYIEFGYYFARTFLKKYKGRFRI